VRIQPLILEHLATAVAAAAVDLQAQFDGVSACARAKAGRSAGDRKAAEGRWAALREVQRRADAGEPALSVAVERLASWSEDLRRHQANGSAADWISYRGGGVSALREFVQASADSGRDALAGSI
jgi:hypothetical protein